MIELEDKPDCAGAANDRASHKAKKTNAEEHAGHNEPSSYPHPHVHAQSAFIPLVAAPKGGLPQISLGCSVFQS